jgi:hypothetical protein
MQSTSTHFSVRNKSAESIVVRPTGFSPLPMALPEHHIAALSETQIAGDTHFDIWWYSVDVYSEDGRKLADKSLICEHSALAFLGTSEKGYVLE